LPREKAVTDVTPVSDTAGRRGRAGPCGCGECTGGGGRADRMGQEGYPIWTSATAPRPNKAGKLRRPGEAGGMKQNRGIHWPAPVGGAKIQSAFRWRRSL